MVMATQASVTNLGRLNLSNEDKVNMEKKETKQERHFISRRYGYNLISLEPRCYLRADTEL